MVGCGAGGEPKPENQVLEERAFETHSAYLLAEAEVLAYWVRNAPSARYARREVSSARALLAKCQEAITEAECSPFRSRSMAAWWPSTGSSVPDPRDQLRERVSSRSISSR